MSLYGPTYHVTPVDLYILFQCNLYISCIMSCGNKIVSNCFKLLFKNCFNCFICTASSYITVSSYMHCIILYHCMILYNLCHTGWGARRWLGSGKVQGLQYGSWNRLVLLHNLIYSCHINFYENSNRMIYPSDISTPPTLAHCCMFLPVDLVKFHIM